MHATKLVEKYVKLDFFKSVRSYNVNVNNVYAINLAKYLVTHERSKHIDLRFHFLNQVNKKKLNLSTIDWTIISSTI